MLLPCFAPPHSYDITIFQCVFRSSHTQPTQLHAWCIYSKDLELKFVDEAAELGMLQLFGHPVKGGLRVTMYCHIETAALMRVAAFMRGSAERHAA